MPAFSAYEFFCGGGMARAGLGSGWDCLFANDIDPRKARAYAENWGAEGLACGDVAHVTPGELPGRADLAWASFPCQDLSLAGAGAGLGAADANAATRSGAFWPFRRLLRALEAEGRAPPLLVLENVLGVLTAAGGADFEALVSTLAEGGRRVGALVIDARRFTPQSRPRVFLVAFAGEPPPHLVGPRPQPPWTPPALQAAHDRLPAALRRSWAWWRLPEPQAPAVSLAQVVEESPCGVAWRTPTEIAAIVASMSPANRAKLDAAREASRRGPRQVGFLYRRTRPDGAGGRIVRAEARFDGTAGCLRTPAGGSSRQTLLLVEDGRLRARLITAREAARLMGLSDDYRLPARYSEAYHVVGDGVAPPVVRHLAAGLLEPLVESLRAGEARAAA